MLAYVTFDLWLFQNYNPIEFQFVFLPECCDYVGNDRHETLALAETLTGDTVQFYRQLAKEKNVWLSLGGIHEIIHDEVSDLSVFIDNTTDLFV